MEINTWLKNGCNYTDGVSIYGALKGHSANLLRLFLRKETAQNAAKLKYELLKLLDSHAEPKPMPLPNKATVVPAGIPKKPVLKVDPKPANTHNSYFYKLNELHPDLHNLSIKQRNDFQIAISLHEQLTRLHPDEEGVALSLSIKIEELFDAIETAQKVLDHYVKHKTVLNIETRSFNDYTGAQLADARRNKRTSVTKFKNRVTALKKDLGQNLSKTDKNKLAVTLEKAENKLLQHEMELQELNELINKK